MNKMVDRVLDVDSHEMIPIEMWGEVFSPAVHAAAKNFALCQPTGPNNPSMPDLVGDVTPINYDSVWNLKGPYAPSAIDLERRPAVLDEMGIERQLVYPTFGLLSMMLLVDPKCHEYIGFDPTTIDQRKLGREGVDAHNRWAAGVTKATGGRARPVGILDISSVETMIRQTEELVATGVRALMMPSNFPPANMSPAARDLDPFWHMCAENNIPVTLHVGEGGFQASSRWTTNSDLLVPSLDKSSLEFFFEPLRATTMHLAAENFVSAMVLGGVFERHPNLRFGVIELTASWVGPLAERMDMWAGKELRSLMKNLSMLPSQYLNRNLRVSLFPFEPIDWYLARYPQLSDVYCYASDFPHAEGGKDSKRKFADALTGASQALHDKFFFENGAWLLPE